MKIEQLRFNNFRGAVQPVELKFDRKKPITLIFGENGTGKSTIADAIDFICNQKFGSLELRKGIGSKQTHIVSANGRNEDLSVEMQYGGKTWHSQLQSRKPITTPASVPKAFVLRRANITKVMEETDGERYKSLADFITVANIESSESALRKVAAAVKKEVNRAIQQKLSAETTLQQFWNEEGRPDDSYMAWARAASQQSVDSIKTQITADTALQTQLEQSLRDDEDLRKTTAVYNQALTTLETAEHALTAASQTEANASTLKTLREARHYLQSTPDSDKCPVCAKPEPRETLLAHVEAELNRLQTLVNLQNEVDAHRQKLTAAEGAYNSNSARWRNSYQELSVLLPTVHAAIIADVEIAPSDAESESISNTLAQLETRQRMLQTRINSAEKTVNQHNALKTHLTTIDELTQESVEKNALAERLQQMHEIVKEERQQHVQQMVDNISATVSDLYNRIHPDEPLGNPNFNLNTKYAGSLKLSGSFGSQTTVSPAAYYSEAHLDTLGLCVYLALAKQSKDAIVVLDDVLTSVDGPHLRRIIDLINEEAPQFGHVIITTHQRAWLNIVRLGRGMQADLIELYGWSMQNGMSHSRVQMKVDELRIAVSAPRLNRQQTASAAGVLLEQLLDLLTLRYACRLPRKNPPSYTLGELRGAINGKLLNSLRIEQINEDSTMHELPLKPLIEACTKDSWIRNQAGAHFNVDESHITDHDVRQFVNNALALADALHCDLCRQLPANNKTGEYWSCGGHCKQLRLYPLQKPA